jgi:tRNA pseudouridine38-40 synthase
MGRYFLELSYLGTRYHGFQIQDTGDTVQSEVEKALQTRFRQPFSLTGSSRTDAGVHAVQNFFHFDTDLAIDAQSVYNLNAILPKDIAVRGIYEVPETAHSRFDAVAREYRYYIHRQKDPFLNDRSWMYPYPLDAGILSESARILLEYNDFTSFSKRNTQVNNYRCQLEISEWTATETGWIYRVKANRFLRGMVRGLVGTMLKVGRGQLSQAEYRAIIESRDCTKADFSTPAQGLFLHRVYYPEPLAALLV